MSLSNYKESAIILWPSWLQVHNAKVRSCIRVAGTLNCSVFSSVRERYSFKSIKLHFQFTPFYWVRKVPRKTLAPILILPCYYVIYLPPPPVNENKLSLPSFYCFLSSILPPQQEKQVEKNFKKMKKKEKQVEPELRNPIPAHLENKDV